jgi:hypothetical protein
MLNPDYPLFSRTATGPGQYTTGNGAAKIQPPHEPVLNLQPQILAGSQTRSYATAQFGIHIANILIKVTY